MFHALGPRAEEEVRRTLQEFRQGRLTVGGQKVAVTSLRQALAIGKARARHRPGAEPPAWPAAKE